MPKRKIRTMLIWVIIVWLIISGLILFHPFYTASHLFVTGLSPFGEVILCVVAAALIIPPIIFLRRVIVNRPAFKDLGPGDWFVIGTIAWLAALPLVYNKARLNMYFYGMHLILPSGIIPWAIVFFFGLCGLLHYKLQTNSLAGQVHFWITFMGFIVLLFPAPPYELQFMNVSHRYIDYTSGWRPEQNAFLNIWLIAVLIAQVYLWFLFLRRLTRIPANRL